MHLIDSSFKRNVWFNVCLLPNRDGISMFYRVQIQQC